jgi:hypothetical protein
MLSRKIRIGKKCTTKDTKGTKEEKRGVLCGKNRSGLFTTKDTKGTKEEKRGVLCGKSCSALFRSGLIISVLVAVVITAAGKRVHAQSDDGIWSEPVNLSHSGAASEPVVVAGTEGQAQAFWWDQFDGITTAYTTGDGAWSASEPSPITFIEITGEGENAQAVYTPIAAMPQIVADVNDRAHAWWLGTPDEETGLYPLWYSRIRIGTTGWTDPEIMAESALTWQMATAPDNTLHLIYLRQTYTTAFPAGLYYKRSSDGGVSWSAPKLLYTSIYFRLLTEEQAHVSVAAGGDNNVYVTWDDPRLGKAFYTRSADGGMTWEELAEIGAPEDGAQRAQVLVDQTGHALLLWEATRAATACALYQQSLTGDGQTWSEPQRVLEDLAACSETLMTRRTPAGQPVLITGMGSGGLSLVAWNGAQWSEPKRLGFSFQDAETGQTIYLNSLWADLNSTGPAIVGQGQNGEIWLLQGESDVLDWAFAPPPLWSEPVAISEGEGLPGLPAIVTGAEGHVHVMWSAATAEGLPGGSLYYARWDGNRWSRPAAVLRSPAGKADQPSLAIVGDQLHVAWSGGPTGEIFYSRAFTRDAYATGAWSEPLPLGDAAGSSPRIVADLAGRLHVVYAVPLNEGRGIVYVRSDDPSTSPGTSGGATWSEATQVFDAAAAGWPRVDHPALAVDEQGTIHVAWVRAPLPGNGLPEGVYYAHSVDQGETWSEPFLVAEGAYDWPQVAATLTGQVHLVWSDVSRGSVRYRWRGTEGEDWAYVSQVPGFREVHGPVALAAAGSGALHLAGIGQDGTEVPLLLHTTWDGERWESPETFRLDGVAQAGPGVAIAVQGLLGRLDVAFTSLLELSGDMWYTGRQIPGIEALPTPVFTLQVQWWILTRQKRACR